MLRRESIFLGESRLCAIVLYKRAGIVPDVRVYIHRGKSGVSRLCKRRGAFRPAQKVDTCLFSLTNAASRVDRAKIDVNAVVLNTGVPPGEDVRGWDGYHPIIMAGVGRE